MRAETPCCAYAARHNLDRESCPFRHRPDHAGSRLAGLDRLLGRSGNGRSAAQHGKR